MSPADPLEGGCLCGAVRYRITPPPLDAAYCHCRLCQKASGAPAMAWVSVPPERFAYVTGAPAVYRSSEWAAREFCGACGSPLVFRYGDPTRPVDVAVTSLDTPESVIPEYHIWTASRVGWFDTADSLPRHAGRGPDS